MSKEGKASLLLVDDDPDLLRLLSIRLKANGYDVTAVDKSFKSKVLDTGERFSFTFARAGTYAYFCGLHPHMTGKVVVTA